MHPAARFTISLVSNAAFWFADRMWGDKVFAWLRANLPDWKIWDMPVNELASIAVYYTPPTILLLAALYSWYLWKWPSKAAPKAYVDPAKWKGTPFYGLDTRDRFSWYETACLWGGQPVGGGVSELTPSYKESFLYPLKKAAEKRRLRRPLLKFYSHDSDSKGVVVHPDEAMTHHCFKRSDLEKFFKSKKQRPAFLYEDQREHPPTEKQ